MYKLSEEEEDFHNEEKSFCKQYLKELQVKLSNITVIKNALEAEISDLITKHDLSDRRLAEFNKLTVVGKGKTPVVKDSLKTILSDPTKSKKLFELLRKEM